MIRTDYRIEALGLLLCADCLPERYCVLLPYKDLLISGLRLLGCRVKSDAERLPDADLLQIGLKDDAEVRLFRRFLALYDADPKKFREIPKVTSDPEEAAAFEELYHLPGVKAVRAALYYRAGYRSIRDFADTSVDEVLRRTADAIKDGHMTCIPPLPKEVRTQIAAARAFTGDC